MDQSITMGLRMRKCSAAGGGDPPPKVATVARVRSQHAAIEPPIWSGAGAHTVIPHPKQLRNACGPEAPWSFLRAHAQCRGALRGALEYFVQQVWSRPIGPELLQREQRSDFVRDPCTGDRKALNCSVVCSGTIGYLSWENSSLPCLSSVPFLESAAFGIRSRGAHHKNPSSYGVNSQNVWIG
jgi:hypothetical protein